jgi:hypothetical protein
MKEYLMCFLHNMNLTRRDSSLTKLPDTKKLLMFGFNIPLKGKPVHEAMDQMRPLLQLVFYCMDKIKRFRLSKEVGVKSCMTETCSENKGLIVKH